MATGKRLQLRSSKVELHQADLIDSAASFVDRYGSNLAMFESWWGVSGRAIDAWPCFPAGTRAMSMSSVRSDRARSIISTLSAAIFADMAPQNCSGVRHHLDGDHSAGRPNEPAGEQGIGADIRTGVDENGRRVEEISHSLANPRSRQGGHATDRRIGGERGSRRRRLCAPWCRTAAPGPASGRGHSGT